MYLTMTSTTVSERPPVEISQLLDEFQDLARASQLYKENPVAQDGKYDIYDLSQSLGEKLINRFVVVKPLEGVQESDEPAITYYGQESTETLRAGVVQLRLRDGHSRLHPVTEEHFTFYKDKRPKRTTGTINGIDGFNASFVVKPSLGRGIFGHHWVRPVAADGLQLVEFKKVV